MESTSEAQLRSRLVELSDELRALPDDEFRLKYELNVEQDAIRGQLAVLDEGRSAETLKQWADRAGRKGSHEVDYEVLAAQAAIPSESDGGGSF